MTPPSILLLAPDEPIRCTIGYDPGADDRSAAVVIDEHGRAVDERPVRDLSLVALDVLTLDAAAGKEWRQMRAERDVRRVPQ